MRVADAFVNPKPIKPSTAAIPMAVTPPPSSQGVFVDPKSLVSFPIATAVVSTIAQALIRLIHGHSAIIGLSVAVAVGGLIFAVTMSDSSARPQTKVGWAVAVSIAVINSLLLYAAMVGIGQLNTTPDQTSPQSSEVLR